MDILVWLSDWYEANCDGDWEHNAGISISSLDNPGWCFKVNITDTLCSGKLVSISNFQSEIDWYEIKSDGYTFTAVGDTSKLIFLIEHFRDFVNSSSSK